jgi:hypothetical protein
MARPESFHVVTPLETQWADTPQEVHDVIDRYMQTDGANLLRVTVSKMRDDVDVGNGEVLAPQEFWQQP